MNCDTCKENKVADVPYIVHESDMARQERTIKKLWIALIIVIILGVSSNAWWVWRESQFVEESWTYEATTDGGSNAVANGEGEVNIYGEGESDAQTPNP